MESSSPLYEHDPGDLARSGVPPLPPPRSRDRDGLSALERKALYRVHTELPAMPASLVVQILLWPEKITDWARDENVTPALVYNMLGGFKPYHGLRQRLADRLGVTKGAVDHLIDARRQQPSTRRIPEPPPDFPADDVALASPREPALGTPADHEPPGSDIDGGAAETAAGDAPADSRRSGSAAAAEPPNRDDRQITLDF